MKTPQTLRQLEHNDAFIERHIGPTAKQQQQMLATVGAATLDALIQQIVPSDIRLPKPLIARAAVTEHQALAELKALATCNQAYKSYIGMGYSATYTPPVLLRNVLQNPGWYTAYTPYQPEISQGRLEALLNFQTVTLELTGLDIASASLLDEATAAAEAMAMARRVNKQATARQFFIADDVHPQTLDVVRTRAESSGVEIIVDRADMVLQYDNVFGVLLQQIGTTGEVHDYQALLTELSKRQIISCVAADIMALVILSPPGHQGADIVFGSAQRFGIPMGYGGPHAAFFACRETYKRAMPGRIIGVSRDVAGHPALRMALQTREQHIRREKANSNICTSQVLLANVAGLYAVYHGPQGLQRIANRIHRLTDILAAGLQQAGYPLYHQNWFDTLTVHVPDKTAVLERAQRFNINLRCDLDNAVGITLDETTTAKDILTLFTVILGQAYPVFDIQKLDKQVRVQSPTIPAAMLRRDPILSHPVFNSYHSETEMMRYLHRLERRDLTLNQTMIPLGSCTMKLNAVAEMLPMTWSEFTDLHPFCPLQQAAGYRQMIAQLSQWLMQLTGFDAFSMQPNSGAQGEYAGLLAIRRYQQSHNETQRHICLIPSSAHGTNPASAQMAGLSVVVVACDKQGNIDVVDLQAKLDEAGDTLSCIMITYPSTHGVYESNIREVCRLVHLHGGQVYLDGANMNAMMGITTPAYIGADVSHLNLHKTFCIPHGGGGPSMGPIGVKSHLAPFLPGHSVVPLDDLSQHDAVSAAPFGSPAILPISWMYLRMMGSEGLKHCSQVALLNANYIATQLQHAYPVLYSGQNQRVAHECILDIRPLKAAAGISEMDIAKRLMDYGFHAPTMSFPVAGTLMVEPTESENQQELDRFIDAMLSIRQEIDRIISGEWPSHDNPLVNAPHTQSELVSDWPHPYSREIAVFPLTSLRDNKFWPTVKRLDDVYGDRHLHCACPPTDDYK